MSEEIRKQSADPSKPHWIVVRMSKHDKMIKRPEMMGGPFYFRHASPDDALEEAKRLAEKFVGKRFSVYGLVGSSKIEKQP